MHWVLKSWRLLPRQYQLLLVKAVQRNKRVYRWLLFRHIEEKDRAEGTRAHLPSPELRYRVSASPDAEEFINVGKSCVADMQSALNKVGYELRSFRRILDFGCGCGRTLIHVRDLAPAVEIEGVDIDANAIQWCRQHLDFAKFCLGEDTPPLGYDSDSFDFIYAISVFTHLDEDHQFRWLEELRRISTPGGILLLTVNGLDDDQQGFVFERSYEKGLFPEWYQNSYHSWKYVFENFGKYFKIVDYFPRSMNSLQDVVVLQKRQE